jgi:enamine deaminase RidA (YjgF/YER057c/UK114 family)
LPALSARRRLASGGSIKHMALALVCLLGYVNVAPEFFEIAQVVNGASDLMIDVFEDASAHTRTAVGVTMMPYNVVIEIEAQFLLR